MKTPIKIMDLFVSPDAIWKPTKEELLQLGVHPFGTVEIKKPKLMSVADGDAMFGEMPTAVLSTTVPTGVLSSDTIPNK
jgi:hypothetical protein